MIPIPTAASAFLAGIVTFLAPCTLPLVPAYLGFLSSATQGQPTVSRRRIILAAVSFILGFSLVFIVLGSLVGFLGSAAGSYRRVIERVGGIFILLFGISLLGLFRIPVLQRTLQLRLGGLPRLPVGPRSFLFGVILASGWTPCIGPILGTILFLAASTTSVGSGAGLLAVYAAGLAVPFLLVALFYSQAAKVIARLARLTRGIEIVAGLFLVFIGFLFLTGRTTAFIGSAYRVLDFINYDALYQFF